MMPSSTATAHVTATDVLFLLAFLLALGVGALYSLWKVGVNRAIGSGGAPPVEKTDCPACGARMPVDGDHCQFCGELLPADRADVRNDRRNDIRNYRRDSDGE